MEAERESVLPLGPPYIVGERVVRAVEGPRRIVSDREIAIANTLEGLEAWLPDADAQIAYIECAAAGRRTTRRVRKLIANDEVIQQAVGERVTLRDECVVVLDVRPVRVS